MIMRKDEFIDAVTAAVNRYLADTALYDFDPQVRVNPVTLSVNLINSREKLAEIAESVETLESAAGAQGEMEEETTEYQVRQNPDFYPVKKLIREGTDGSATPDEEKITAIAAEYFD